MSKLIGTDNNQISTNGMLGGMAFQTPEDVKADKIQENDFNVVSQTDIGLDPNQIPLNQFLGSNAFTNIDYTFGTWSPNMINLGNHTKTTGSTGGWYLKLGNIAIVHFNYQWSGRTTTNGAYNVYINNLPFRSPTTNPTRLHGGVFISGLEGIRSSSGRTHYGGYINDNNLFFRASGDDVSENSLDGSIASVYTNGYIYGHAIYTVQES